MKKIFILPLILISTLSLGGTGHDHAHGGHSHSHAQKSVSVSKEKAIELGRFHIERLIEKGKLDKSWKDSNHEKSEKKIFKTKLEWLLVFTNEKGVKGKKLFIFLKHSGEFVAANFTGK